MCGPRMIYTLKSTYCLIPQSVGYLFGKHEFYARFHKLYLGYTSCKQRRLDLLGHMHFKFRKFQPDYDTNAHIMLI